ncbi:MAG: AMP-binding protein, partial [Fimbriimonadaceae bacterium]|nr:AMP-binding protein [Fimbriimonadaceae bacterium]
MTPRDVTQAPNPGEMIRRAAHLFSDRVAQMRPEKGEFQSVTYGQLFEDVWTFARGISTLGLERGDRIVILGETCWEWAVADWASQTLGLITVPIYPTLPADQAQYILEDCQAKAALVLTPSLARKLSGVPILGLKKFDGADWIQTRAADATLDRATWESAMIEVDPEQPATFIYTSGTTGNPKGVILPHRCFTSLSDGILGSIPVNQNDRFLSFLPLAHVFERYAGHVLPMSLGACVAYAGSLASLSNDMQKVRPTVMLCIPRFLDATKAKIQEGVRKQKPLNQKLFHLALDQGAKKRRGEFAPLAGVLDRLVGEKLRQKVGGRLRFFVSGGAA